MTAFITPRVVRVSCQIWQNAAEEPPVGAEVPLRAEAPVAVELPLGTELLIGAEVPLEAELPAEAGPQADSARASAAVINGDASNTSRPLVRGVRFMPL